jgi:selenocysteine lyase/cysteine desulfurase
MDPESLRASMPALEETAYLNTGASSPSHRRVVEAMTDFLTRHGYEAPTDEGMYPVAFDAMDATRETVADFVGADGEEIALTNSTADGISRVAAAIDWEPGDVVVRTDLEHPAGTLPWDRLADVADIEVRVVETEGGRLSMDALKDAVADARLVTLSSLTWTHGTQLPVGQVVDIAHDAGAQVLVDAVQSPGQVPVDVKRWGADFVAGAGHKWLMGVWGGGFLYVDSDAIATLEPRRLSYMGVEEMGGEGYDFRAGARRFEIGTTSPLPYVGLAEAIDTVEDIGMETIQDHVEPLTARLKEGLDDEQLLSPETYESGLVTFRVEDPEATVQRLAEEGVVVRSLPHPDRAVRASVHVFNTAADIDRLLAGL